ncbi:hypothetical protein SKAU_G00230130 [Synaphobranchus kaupii]|uniref:Inositol polyphosphate 1-phosphatase n=1 Tax=Synaphobranchus kaupii TaxID=118154 RepID=A0A9Q1ISW7_SYNKA|nr:hypothetical protein SKAU_G00230130 [Synaphobranchus kaupii]
MSELMRTLVRVSEKAADIVRVCRQEESLFSLLIEEKKEDEKNKRFVTDFKTLADVLIQEVIKHDIGKQFPGIENNIFGEESHEFTNRLGEKIQVQVCETEQDTCRLLCKVLQGNVEAAKALARAAHGDLTIPDLRTGDFSLPLDSLGVWVDPIGGMDITTGEYHLAPLMLIPSSHQQGEPKSTTAAVSQHPVSRGHRVQQCLAQGKLIV